MSTTTEPHALQRLAAEFRGVWDEGERISVDKLLLVLKKLPHELYQHAFSNAPVRTAVTHDLNGHIHRLETGLALHRERNRGHAAAAESAAHHASGATAAATDSTTHTTASATDDEAWHQTTSDTAPAAEASAAADAGRHHQPPQSSAVDIVALLDEDINAHDGNLHAIERDLGSATNGVVWIARTLQFLSAFVAQLARVSSGEVGTSASPSSAARQAYHDTLAPFHGWFISQIVKVALHSVPNKEHLQHSFQLSTQAEAVEALSQLHDAVQPVADKLHDLLRDRGCWFTTKASAW